MTSLYMEGGLWGIHTSKPEFEPVTFWRPGDVICCIQGQLSDVPPFYFLILSIKRIDRVWPIIVECLLENGKVVSWDMSVSMFLKNQAEDGVHLKGTHGECWVIVSRQEEEVK